MNGGRGRLVCVGTSWGGVSALRMLLGALPASLAAPLCVVQHRSDVDDVRQLVPLLRRTSKLRVCEPEDKQPLEPGTAYIAPAGYHLLVEDRHISLSAEDRVRWSRPSIDVLFESAAHDYGSNAVAVVLTGANDDGARGAQAVHAAGGVVLVQDPQTAERPEMPQATIATGAVTQVLPLAELADAVVRHVGENDAT